MLWVSAQRTYGQFPANLYPAACASASLAKRTWFCGETFVALEQSALHTDLSSECFAIPIRQEMLTTRFKRITALIYSNTS